MTEEDSKGRWMSTEVRKDNRLFIPEPFREIVFQGEGDEAITFWGVEESQSFAVLSNRWLTKPGYDSFGSYDAQNESGSRVHIAKDVRDETEVEGDSGDILYLFSFGDMLSGETRSAYVLTERQGWELLPLQNEGSESEVAKTVLNKVPGFLSEPE